MPDNKNKSQSQGKNQSKDPGQNPGQNQNQNHEPAPNDQRSNVKNPNHPAHAADRANREKLGHIPMERAPSASVPQPDAAPDKHK